MLGCFFGMLATKCFSQAPAWVWAKDAHSNASEWATDVAVDPVNGDVVVVGVFNSDLSAVYGSNFSGAIGGGFVARYDASGNVLWAFPIGNNQDDACNSVTISASGNIYVTGYLQNIADFRGTSATSNIVTSVGGKDIFIAKYNMLGQLQWVRRAGGSSDDEGYSVCTNTNNIFITGYFTGSGSFSGIPTISNQPNENLFVASYDANGNIQWVTDGGSGLGTFGRDISADNTGVYIVGDFLNTTLNIYDYTGANVATLINSNGSKEDAYVMSLSVLGPFNWINGIHSNNSDFGRGVAQNSSGIYVTGSISSSANFPGYASNPVNITASGLDMYVAQLSKLNGTTNWVKSEPGSSNEEGMSVVIDTLNLVCIAGYYQSSLNFSGGASLTSTGGEDVFVAAYNNSGNYQWATTAGANGSDIAHGVSTAVTGEIYVAGEYENSAAFGANTLTADAPKNIFVAKLGCSPVANNIVTAAQTICAGQTPATLNGTVPTGGPSFSYLWQSSLNSTTWSSATGTNNAQNYSPPALFANTYFRRIVSQTTGCLSSDTSSSILITVNQPPTTANAGRDSSICTNTITMYANAVTVGTATWTLIAGSGTITTAGSPTTSVTNLGLGANAFVWSTSNGVCPVSKDTVVITQIIAPTTANAGADQAVCSSTYTLSGNIPTAGTGTWTVVSGGGTVTTPTSHNSTVTGMGVGQNVFVWTIANACGSSSDTVRIKRDAPPTASNAGSNQNICAYTYTLNANTPAVGIGNWTVLSGGASVSNAAQPNSPVTGLSVGANNFIWTITNGSCPASKDTVTITVSAPPSIANAGSNQNICSNTYTLNANAPTTGIGTWSVLTGGATVVSSHAPNSIANNLSTGNNIFIWTITNGACAPSSDSVTIVVTAMPSTSNAGSNQTICNDSTNLNANTPAVGTGSWSVVSGGGSVANPSQNNSLAYNLSVGNNVFMWTITNGVCPASTSTVNVNVSASPGVANAGSDQVICSSTVTLNASAPSPGSGVWSLLTGSGSISSPSANISNVSGLSVGVNSFVWTVSNGACPANKDTVKITVDQNPSQSNAGNNFSVCSSASSLNATVPTVGTGVWNVVSGGATVVSPLQNNSAVNGLSTGVNAFEWVVSNGICPASRDTVYINAYQNPTVANAGSDQTLCSSSSVLTGNTPSVGSGAWTVVAGGGLVTNPSQANSNVTGLTTGQNVFVWSISNGTCPASTDTVKINIDAMPSAANAGSSQNVCSTSALLNAINPLVGTGTWSVVQGGASVSSPASNTSAVSGLTPGVNIFQWTVSNGTCPSSSDTVVINVNSPPSMANAGSDQVICSSSASLNGNIPLVGSGSWSLVSGSGIVASPSSPSSGVSGLGAGQNIFAWSITNGVCPASVDSVMITVSQPPSVANAGPDQNVCVNTSSVTLAAVAPSPGNGTWTLVSGSGTFSNATQNNSGVSGLALGTNVFVWTVSNSVCPSTSDTVRITVFPMPTSANAGNDTTVDGGAVTVHGNTPLIGTGSWSVVAGTGSFANPAGASTQVSGLSIGDNIFSWTISNGVCPDSHDEVTVHVNDLAIPNGFSPNGDLVNDNFEIPGLDLFNGVKLEVFNRWGNLVYENDNYKNDWGGRNQSGEELTDDTYYYVLTVLKNVHKGFVVLKRK